MCACVSNILSGLGLWFASVERDVAWMRGGLGTRCGDLEEERISCGSNTHVDKHGIDGRGRANIERKAVCFGAQAITDVIRELYLGVNRNREIRRGKAGIAKN